MACRDEPEIKRANRDDPGAEDGPTPTQAGHPAESIGREDAGQGMQDNRQVAGVPPARDGLERKDEQGKAGGVRGHQSVAVPGRLEAQWHVEEGRRIRLRESRDDAGRDVQVIRGQQARVIHIAGGVRSTRHRADMQGKQQPIESHRKDSHPNPESPSARLGRQLLGG